MKKIDTLNEIVTFIQRKHKDVKSLSGQGVYAAKFLRKPSGDRVLVEELNGFRLVDFQICGDNNLVIRQMGAGFVHKSNKKHSLMSRIYLSDLAVINVFDHCTQFYSNSSLDFAYVLNSVAADIEHIAEWIYNQPEILRAQWVAPSDNVDDALSQLVSGRVVHVARELPRLIDMEFDEEI